eukprot:1136202-Pelagomonas_calceolata.AAC.2
MAACIEKRSPVLKGRPHTLWPADQEEEQAQRSTSASWPPRGAPWDLQHDYQVGPQAVQQAQDPPLRPKHAHQHPGKGPPLPYES